MNLVRRSRMKILLLVTLLRIVSPAEGDAEVSCGFMKSCILPCSFQGGTDVYLCWHQLTAGNPCVHCFYNNKDQLDHQDQRFRNRTSLFKDQISRGNASLLLTGVQIQDEGRYACITDIDYNKESVLRFFKKTRRKEWKKESEFIIVQVDAPVSQIHIEQVGNRIMCRSEGIYPQPEITWSTNPQLFLKSPDKPRVQQSEQQLYNISGSLLLPDGGTNLVYSCTISTRSNRRRATLKKLSSVTGSSSDTSVSCTSSNSSIKGFILVWWFNRSQTIVTWTSLDVPYTVSEQWRGHVKDLRETGRLTLQHLSKKEEGTYTCELSDDEGTTVSDTFVMIEEGSSTITIVCATFGIIFISGLLLLGLYWKCRCRDTKRIRTSFNLTSPPIATERSPLK